jgi:hypothetical protein
MPASIIRDNVLPSSQAGPSVATILVRFGMAAIIAQPARHRAPILWRAFSPNSFAVMLHANPIIQSKLIGSTSIHAEPGGRCERTGAGR